MAPPTETPASSDAPPQDDAAAVSAIAVRSDHWKTITDFITAQSVVLNYAVPEPIYRLQTAARQQYKAMESMLNKYKFADDMVEIIVILDKGDQQKVRVFQETLKIGVENGERSTNSRTIKDENSFDTNNSMVDSTAVQRRKATTKKETASTEYSQASTKRNLSFNTAKSAGISSCGASDASNSASNKRTASASQATTGSSKEVFRRAALGLKQKSDNRSSLDKPQVSATTPVIRSDMRKKLEESARAHLVQLKKSDPVGVSQTREPKLATRKTPKDCDILKHGKYIKSGSPTFKFTVNGSRFTQKSTIRLDTFSTPKDVSSAHQTYSKFACSSHREVPHAGAKIDVGPHAILEDKTNKGEASPEGVPESDTKKSTHSQPAQPVIKRKTIAADGTVIAVDSVPVTAKRPRPNEEAHAEACDQKDTHFRI